MSSETIVSETAGIGMRAVGWITRIQLLLIGLWIGAAVFFSFGVAPSVFRELPSRELAGMVVQRTLALINIGGVGVGIIALLLLLPRRALGAFRFGAAALMLMVMAAATAIGQWVIAARLRALKVQMGSPIDLIPPTNALRQSFDQLHGYSVMALTVAMVAALAAWLLIAGNTRISSSRAS